MEIRRVPVSKLNPAAYNPRKDLQPGDAEYQKLARSLDKFGCVEPVVWNERTGNVVGGHQRLKILLAAGETELDVSVVNLSDADEKALNIALNKIAGEWDTAALTELLQELSADSSIDETLTGFDRGELDNLLADLEGRAQGLEPAGVDDCGTLPGGAFPHHIHADKIQDVVQGSHGAARRGGEKGHEALHPRAGGAEERGHHGASGE